MLSRGNGGEDATRAATAPGGVQRIDRDIEAPEIYQASDSALWDGRPSLGGVWVAAPDVTEPERVIIRNVENGQNVVGALFKRERDNPGPVMQLSSEAAVALGILAGAPTQVEVIALRRDESAAPAAALPAAGLLPEPDATPAGSPDIEATSLDAVDGTTDLLADGPADTAAVPVAATDVGDDVLAAATAAVEAAEAAPAAAAPAPLAPVLAASVAAPAPVEALPEVDAGPLTEPYIQIGRFNSEQNAMETARRLSKAGVLSTVLTEESGDAAAWRVVAGPADTAADRAVYVQKAWDLGFTDAYPVDG